MSGVFIAKAASGYDDRPTERYQFPPVYLNRARACVGEWVVYYEPVKVRDTRGYWAVARVASVQSDPDAADRHLALIEPGSFLQFPTPVPFSDADGPVERGLLGPDGRLGGQRQSAIRALSPADFRRIVERGLADADPLPPRVEEPASASLHEAPAGYDAGASRAIELSSRAVRDRAFRRAVLTAYGERCAVTGLRLINGGGRAEAEAAHIRPVAAGGPDAVGNGLALSGTAHWMFDRGLIGLADDGTVLISRQSNDPAGVGTMVNPTGRALAPPRAADRPHPRFLAWHREHVFKA